jgi:hypothetical protein
MSSCLLLIVPLCPDPDLCGQGWKFESYVVSHDLLSTISNLFSVLMKCFNGFCKEGVVHADTVNDILEMMGLRVKKEALDAIIAEVDEDGKSNDVGSNHVVVSASQ